MTQAGAGAAKEKIGTNRLRTLTRRGKADSTDVDGVIDIDPRKARGR